ncbi:MmgE/PrpD family protein [Castellaniella sp.]|uniref:MmgE/PrpD family protein n=1 Tax=Castellaniella sp. TaxID=1955812 RepID=UPI003C76AEA0
MRASLTARLIERSLGFGADELPRDVAVIATHCLLDWMGMALAGSREPDAGRLMAELVSEGSPASVTVWGRGVRLGLSQAVLANGMAAHLLDFDDTHLASRVHPSAPLWPAILAVCETERLPGGEALAAFAAGVEMQTRLAAYMGESHYRLGWHNTATLGCFGAVAAVGRLYGLKAETLSRALTIAATQSGGLRMVFGTACKAYQVARSAVVGLQAVRLARSGMDAPVDVFDRPDGFAGLYARERFPDAPQVSGAHWHARDIVFKYHESCYGTQAPVEAALLLRARCVPGDIESVHIDIEPQYLSVCDVLEPATALQAKFSVRHMVALALSGGATAGAAGFSSAARADPRIRDLCRKTEVRGDASLGRAQARVTLKTRAGSHEAAADASRPERDLERQWRRLCEKSSRVLGADYPAHVLGAWQASLAGLGEQDDFGAWAGHAASLLGASSEAAVNPRGESRNGGICNG